MAVRPVIHARPRASSRHHTNVFNRPLATHAADLKARHGLGLGDAFAAALALATRSPLLTGDADFRALEEHGLALEWVGGD